MDMVILAPEYPASDVVELLGNPLFHRRLTYIAGSVLMDRDLHRASATKAEAIWLLSNKFSDRPDEEDSLTVLRSLQLNTFMGRDYRLGSERGTDGVMSAEYESDGSSWSRRRRFLAIRCRTIACSCTAAQSAVLSSLGSWRSVSSAAK